MGRSADILFTNVNLATMDPKPPIAYGAIEDAVLAVENGSIVWCGPRADAPEFDAMIPKDGQYCHGGERRLGPIQLLVDKTSGRAGWSWLDCCRQHRHEPYREVDFPGLRAGSRRAKSLYPHRQTLGSHRWEHQ